MDASIHRHYRDYTTGPSLFQAIVFNYSQESSVSQALLLTQLAGHKPSVDMDEALPVLDKMVRQMIASFGDEMDTTTVCYILFLHNLHEHYQHVRLNAITASEFSFDDVRAKLKEVWYDI